MYPLEVPKPEAQAQASKPQPTQTVKKSNEEVAKEVLAGKWGNGAERKAKLESAGYNYAIR